MTGEHFHHVRRVTMDELTPAELTAIAAGVMRAIPVGVEEIDSDDGGPAQCYFCDREWATWRPLGSHVLKDHPQFNEVINRFEKSGGTLEAARQHASNRQVIAKMEEWGWKQTRKRRDMVVMELEGVAVKVFAPGVHSNNPSGLLLSIYDMTGVSSEEFWNGPVKTEAEPETEDAPVEEAERKTYLPTGRMCLELLHAQKRPMHVGEIAEMLGLKQVNVISALSDLHEKGLVSRVRRGTYLAVEKHVQHHDITADAEVRHHQAAMEAAAAIQPVITAPSRPVEAPEPIGTALTTAVGPGDHLEVALTTDNEITEADIYEILDMLVPKGFKAQDYPMVSEWVRITRELVNSLRSRGR